jgi:hypothetical protein
MTQTPEQIALERIRLVNKFGDFEYGDIKLEI